jgi:hypothetical protein
MDTHTFLSNGDIEYTIIARPRIHCITHCDGIILIDTGTKSINIHLRKTSHGGVPFKIGDERDNQTPSKVYSAAKSLKDVAQEDGDETYEAEKHTESNQERDGEDTIDTTTKFNQFCGELATKILKN